MIIPTALREEDELRRGRKGGTVKEPHVAVHIRLLSTPQCILSLPFPTNGRRPHRTACSQWSEQIESIAKYLFPLIVPGSVPGKCFWNETEQRGMKTSILHRSDSARSQRMLEKETDGRSEADGKLGAVKKSFDAITNGDLPILSDRVNE